MEARRPLWRLLYDNYPGKRWWLGRDNNAWSDFEYILKIEPIGFADRLNLVYERKKHIKDNSESSDLTNWKKCVALY